VVRSTSNGSGRKVFVKILYWGPHKGGKTTIVETLHRLTKENDIDIIPTGDMQKIEKYNGATLYFDKATFQSLVEISVYYDLYTVPGSVRFKPIRKKIFRDIDGIIFVFNSEKSQWENNIKSLKELKELATDTLINKIPLVVMLNKKDLQDSVSMSEVEQLLKDEGLMYEEEHPLYIWNPIIFETIGTYKNQKNVFRAFKECARRAGLYSIYGTGSAPTIQIPEKKIARVNFTLPNRLKNEWEIFAKETLGTSLSQMIRNAVKEYRSKYEQLEKQSGNIEMQLLEMRIEKMISEKMEKMIEKFKLQSNTEIK